MQQFDGLGRIAVLQRKKRAKSRQITEPHQRILREALFQVIRERLSGRITRERQGQGSAILHIPAVGKMMRRHGPLPRLARIPEKDLSHRCSDFVLSRHFPAAHLPRKVGRAL